MWPFRRPYCSNLSTSLLKLSRHDNFRLSDALEGCLALGATGSGKSTGPGKPSDMHTFLRGWADLY